MPNSDQSECFCGGSESNGRSDASSNIQATLEAQWCRGDEIAIALVFQNLRERLSRRLFRKYRPLLSIDEAEWLLGIGIAHAWACHTAFDPARGSFEGWLWLNVKQAAAKEIRRRWRRNRFHERPYPPEKLALFVQPAPSNSVSGAGEIAADDNMQLFNRAMTALSPIERAILWSDACSADGLQASGILARELGIPKATVRSHRARARQKLKRALLELGYQSPKSGAGATGVPSSDV